MFRADPYDNVSVLADNALNGLYITPDMCIVGGWIVNHLLADAALAFHARQPKTTDYDHYGELINDAYHVWRDNRAGPSSPGDVLLADYLLLSYDLSMTYRQIRRAVAAAADILSTLHLRTLGVESANEYLPVIPHALDDWRINGASDVTDDVLHRIFSLDPWQSLFERLAAQKHRSERVLRVGPDLAEEVALRFENVARSLQSAADTRDEQLRRRQGDEATRRSIQRSLRMFRKLGKDELVRAFWRSNPQDALAKPLVLAGKRYDYHIWYKNNIVEDTKNFDRRIAPAHIVLHNKEGERVCEVCLYFKDTPILDFVLGMDLMVRNEETEMDILNKACVVEAPRTFYSDPVLPSLKNLHDPVDMPVLISNVFKYAQGMTRSEWAAAKPVYQAAMKHGFRAYRQITRPRARYLSLMRQCGLVTHASGFCEGPHTEGGRAIAAVQRAMAEGTY